MALRGELGKVGEVSRVGSLDSMCNEERFENQVWEKETDRHIIFINLKILLQRLTVFSHETSHFQYI